MTEMVGADVAALRSLGLQLQSKASQIEAITTQVRGALSSSPWHGQDAQEFRQEWTQRIGPSLRHSARSMREAGLELKVQADQQEQTSNDGGGSIGRSATGVDFAKSLFAVGMAGKKVFTSLSRVGKFVPLAKQFMQAGKLADIAGDLTKWGDGFFDNFLTKAVSNKFGPAAGKFLGKGLGAVGGLYSIYDGFKDMFNPDHEGWRGWGDRIAGGLNVVSGAGMVTIALGGAALLGPVGVGVVLTAGAVAAVWQLGNAIADNWDTIKDYGGRAINAVTDFAKDAGNAVINTAKAGWDAVSNAAGKVGNFFGGLFS